VTEEGGGRSGSVLSAVVLVLLGMTLLAHGAFVLANRQLQISGVSRELLRASLAAEAGLALAVGEVGLHQSLTESITSVTRAWSDRSTLRVASQRLTDELSWLTAEGESSDLPVPVRLGALVWTLDPVERVVAQRGVVTASSASSAGVSSEAWWTIPLASDTLACSAALSEMFAQGAQRPAVTHSSVDSVALGRIPLSDLEVHAGLRVSGAVTPGPAVAGEDCLEGLVSNWGDPSSSSSPCARLQPLIWSSSDLLVVGGAGQGILAVQGAVSFSAGVHFRGIVLARGDVSVEDGSVIEGIVRGSASVRVEPGSTVRGSACSAWSVLSAVTSLRFPVPLEPRRRFYLP